MQAVGTKDTGPEMNVRRALFSAGYRFRVHRRDLPGTPDIVFSGRKKVIFVHGCFWHGHDCKKGRGSKSKVEYWGPKLEANRSRDIRNIESLTALGWDSLVVWQCELADPVVLMTRLTHFLALPKNSIDKIKVTR